MESKNGMKVKVPLVVKLIAITSIIVVFSSGIATLVSSYFFMRDSSTRAEENNMTLVQVFSTRMQNELQESYTSSMILLDTLRTSSSKTASEVFKSNFFARNAKIAYIGVPGFMELYNDKFFISNEKEESCVENFLVNSESRLRLANEGELFTMNATAFFEMPMLALVSPYADDGTKNRIVILFSTENLQGSTEASNAYTTYAISDENEILVYPDYEILKTQSFTREQAFYDKISEATLPLLQFKYEENGEKFFIAISKVDFGRFVAISQVPVSLVYKAVYFMILRNSIIVAIILFLAILAIYFFAQNISRPVIALKDAAERIETGDYDVKLKPKTYDEIGLLTNSFVKMGKGLAERERLRETFGRFVNKDIAEKAARGELKLGGERKNATIFFSDIRSFTAISEKLNPEQVVEFLNAYMTRMVDCIQATGGVVDKFIGDAIMGIWGVPISTGDPAKDAEQAIKAMLMMRKSLQEFNKDRGTPDKPLIKIGCGLNTGPCIAGQIGSEKRMEYTVIGDTVNTASRIEALNKPFGTDILISENTYKLLQGKLIVEAMPSIKVKGKTDPLQIFAVVNFKGEDGPQTLKEVRAMLGIQTPVAIADPDKEEVKYEILSQK
ncbi:MAG: adenylate/guanylate cyclase domain-containing protein [Treponemataceae bacterium]